MKMVPESKAEKENKNRFWNKLEEIFALNVLWITLLDK